MALASVVSSGFFSALRTGSSDSYVRSCVTGTSEPTSASEMLRFFSLSIVSSLTLGSSSVAPEGAGLSFSAPGMESGFSPVISAFLV